MPDLHPYPYHLRRGLHDQRRREIAEILLRAGIGPGMTTRSTSPLSGSRGGPSPADAAGPLRWLLTTEQPATVWDWERWDFVDEILLMEGLSLPASRQVPLLDGHSRSSVEDQIGSVIDFAQAEISGFAALEATIRFAADDKAQRTLAKVRDGHLTDGSVGYRVTQATYVPEGQRVALAGKLYPGPIKLSTGWELKEFSMTPIGADSLAKVRSALRQ